MVFHIKDFLEGYGFTVNIVTSINTITFGTSVTSFIINCQLILLYSCKCHFSQSLNRKRQKGACIEMLMAAKIERVTKQPSLRVLRSDSMFLLDIFESNFLMALLSENTYSPTSSHTHLLVYLLLVFLIFTLK